MLAFLCNTKVQGVQRNGLYHAFYFFEHFYLAPSPKEDFKKPEGQEFLVQRALGEKTLVKASELTLQRCTFYII